MSEFLRRRHGNKYYIINTSERQTYDADRYFGGRVTNYHWPDHHGPPFAFLYAIARQGYNWLKGKHSANCASIRLWWLTRFFCRNSWPLELYYCPLQFGKGTHGYSNLRHSTIHGLFWKRRQVPQILRAYAIHLWKRREPAVPASIFVLLWSILPKKNQVACGKKTAWHSVRASTKHEQRWLRSFFRDI